MLDRRLTRERVVEHGYLLGKRRRSERRIIALDAGKRRRIGVEPVLGAGIPNEQNLVASPLGDLDRFRHAIPSFMRRTFGGKVRGGDEPRAEHAKAIDRETERRDQRETRKARRRRSSRVGARRSFCGTQNWK